MIDDDRVLPHSLEAERAVLGALLLSEKAWPLAASVLAAGDFFRDAHRRIYEAVSRLAERQVAVDLVTLRDELMQAGDLDEVGGPAAIAALTDGVPRSANVEHYARIVREKARLRLLVGEAARLGELAYSNGHTAAALIDGAVNRLTSVVRADSVGVVTAADGVRAYASALAAGTAGEPVPTGYADLDELIAGFRPADLVVVAARPSVGKTSWALGCAKAMARKQQRVSLFFTLEMRVDGLAERLISHESGVPSAAFTRGTASTEEYGRVAEACAAFDDIPLLFEAEAATIVEMGAWCRRVKQERALGCVFVDYLQLLLPESANRQQSREAEVEGVSRGLKRLAKTLDVPVVALSQLNRAPEGRADKRPHTSDLRGSGALEQDADMAILLFRPEMYQRTPENDGVTEVIVAKNRNGPTGIVRLFFNKDLTRFDNFAPGAGASSQE